MVNCDQNGINKIDFARCEAVQRARKKTKQKLKQNKHRNEVLLIVSAHEIQQEKKNGLNHELSRLFVCVCIRIVLWCCGEVCNWLSQKQTSENRNKYRVQMKCYLKMVSLNLKQSQRPIIHFSLLLFYAIKWKDDEK